MQDRLAVLLRGMEQFMRELAENGLLAEYPGNEKELATWKTILHGKFERDIAFLEQTLTEGLEAHKNGTKLPRHFAPYLKGKSKEESEELFWANALATCVRFQRRKTIEIVALLSVTNSMLEVQDAVLELCAGVGDLGRILAASGHPAVSLELDAEQVQVSREVTRTVLGGSAALHKVEVADILTSELVRDSEAKLWLAKHPCALGYAMPDEIITRWLANPSAEKLVLMTCCQGKAKRAFPQQLGQFIEPTSWRELCAESDRTNHPDHGVCCQAQNAMDKIDTARVEFILSQGAFAELRHARATYKGNIIVAQKG